MSEATPSVWEELASPLQTKQLYGWARQHNWGLALLLIGWLHLLAFLLCYYLTIAQQYHDSPGYLALWVGEVIGVGLIVRLCTRRRPGDPPFPTLGRFVVRLWLAYLILAFNLCTMNGLRGHHLFELFPAMATLASFGFLVMTFAVDRRFFRAVLVMFAAGLLMSAFLLHAYLVFALAWWMVLNGIGLSLSVKAVEDVTTAPVFQRTA